MRFSYTAATLAMMAGSVYGHTRVYQVWVDGAEPAGTAYQDWVRSPENNNPVKDLTSPDIVCNTKGASAAPKFLSVGAGSELEFEWYHNTRKDDIIDGSHKGPLITYIAPYTEGMDGTGAIWTKIAEEVYSGGQWPVDKLKSTTKSQPVKIPSSLKAGKYLVRHEIIAHHESDTTYDVNPARGAQFYPSCLQLEVTGTGSDVPPQNFDFNTGYKYSDAGIHFNLYSADASSYKAPGPEVWTGGSGSGSGSGSSPAPTTTAAPVATSAAAAVPTTLTTKVSSAAPVATSAAASTPSQAPSTGCKRRRSRQARRSAH